jgi:hypothetical protein
MILVNHKLSVISYQSILPISANAPVINIDRDIFWVKLSSRLNLSTTTINLYLLSDGVFRAGNSVRAHLKWPL